MGFVGLVQVAIQHLGSYVELAGQAAAEYRASFLRRALYAAAALVACVATVVAAWVTGLALLWDTPWRTAYCAASVVLFLSAATLFTLMARHRPAAGPYVRTLRAEAAQDLALLEEWRRAQ